MYSPRWLFLVPGLVMIVLGLLGYAVALPGLRIAGVQFDVHTLLFASLAVLAGHQSLWFGACSRVFAMSAGLLPPNPRALWVAEHATLERGLLSGVALLLAGLCLLLVAVGQWWDTGFGALDPRQTMRWAIPGATLFALGVQTIFSSFFLGVLALQRR